MHHAPVTQIGDYVVEAELPPSGRELAYLAAHRVLPRRARIAIVHPDQVSDRAAGLRLIREVCLLESLQHAGIPRAYDCGVLDGRTWIATEHVAGTSIAASTLERPLTIGAGLAVLRDTAAILAHVHARGVVHRQLTPGVILLTPDRGFPVSLGGWSEATAAGLARPLAARGDSELRAPELLAHRAADARSDVFALGAIGYLALTGLPPDRARRDPGVPAPIHALLGGMLARVPDERPSAAAVATEAGQLLEVFADGERVEQVDVELVDISRAVPPIPGLGWIPPTPVIERARDGAIDRGLERVPRATMRRRRQA